MNRETGVFDSWEIQSKTLAIKHCDKSFFEHKGSGVPHEIKWFFNDNGLKAYEKKVLLLFIITLNMKEYIVLILIIVLEFFGRLIYIVK